MTTSNDMRLGRSFAWLNVTQFLGALNDNVFKLLIIYFILSRFGDAQGGPENIIARTTGVFVVPFLLFSHAGGVLADRFSKRTVIVSMKCLEVLFMALGCLVIAAGRPAAAYGVVFLIATHSALFGPSKYGIIPELVGPHRLSKANSALVGLTYVAIIMGTFFPTLFLTILSDCNYLGLACCCVAIAGLGLAASTRIERTRAVRSQQRFSALFLVEIVRTLRRCRADRELTLALWGSAYFLFLGGYVQQNIILYAQSVLHWNWEDSGRLFPIAALGIGVGAWMCGRLSGRNVEFGLVPIGAIGLTLSCVALFFCERLPAVCVWIFAVGVSSGLFIVPLSAFIQYRTPRDKLGEVLAANNFLSFSGVLMSACVVWLLSLIPGFTSRTGFLVAGLLTLGLTVIACRVLPDFLVRLLGVLIARGCYRMRVLGLDHLPAEGPALLIPNHVTWMDAVLISATQQRRIRFLMYRGMYENRRMKPIYKLMGVIPISGADSPRQMLQALKQAREELERGFLVCIFAEGALTRNANMRDFKPGFERIVRGTEVPIIPIHISGGWGSIFSHYYGRPLTTLKPRRFPYPIAIHFGAPMPSTSTPAEVRLRVQELGGETVNLLKQPDRTLARLFIKGARQTWFRHAMGDTTGKRLTFGKTLIAAIALSHALKPLTRGQKNVGVLMPASVGGALVNLALTLLGRTTVNINFTASAQAVQSAVSQAGLSTIISSRAFLEKLPEFTPPPGVIVLEDIMPRITGMTRLKALLMAHWAPANWILGAPPAVADDVATIIFSSGSTAEPKGVMLSHHNVVSNIESFSDLMHFSFEDRMCAALPFFHSFGFTVTLWCPLICGFSVHFHANPLDGAKVAEMVRQERLTILLSTPTFLLAYIRRATREDFQSLRYVITGAEKLKKRIADAFEEHFGIRPLEGYGTTELSPAVSVNVPDVSEDIGQLGTKEGTIGHPIPGVAIKIVDVETGALLPYGAEGLVMVKGPNVMLGYLNQPEKTAEAIRDGWYNTGDIGKMDADGFVTLVDRLSRFSKIGGEMVPHLAIEEKFHEVLGATHQVLVVTSVPDEKKGEKLAVLYTPEAGEPKAIHKALEACDMPNLWKPRLENYVPIETIPVLGSGKLDLKGIREMALAGLQEKPGMLRRMVDKVKDALHHHGDRPQ